MFKPLRSKGNRTPVSAPQFIPAPTKGWYVGVNIADAPEGTALVLDNAFPQTDYVRLRRGSKTHGSIGSLSSSVLSILTWVNGVADRMFAAAGGSFYDVTTSTVGSPILPGQGSDYWESIQFSPTGSVTTLLACNGLNPVVTFDGTTWSQNSPAITGLTFPVAHLWSFKSRVYLIEAGTLHAWYLALGAIGGAAVEFDLGGIFKLGGSLLVGATWSIDSTAGVFESCVFVTTEGEVAMYDGAYPGDPNWTLKGLYKVSKPLGRRCLMRAGGDLAIMTEDGIVPMSKVMTLDEAALQNQAVTLAIAPAWREAVIERQHLPGWQITVWPLESMGVINLPKIAVDDHTQFIANVRSGAWARYLGWDANCFAVFQSALYYGTSDGRVMQAEVGGKDDGLSYSTTVFPSFTPLGAPASQKLMKMVRYFFRTNLPLAPQITIKVDFDALVPPAPAASPGTPLGALFGTAHFGVDFFAQLPAPQQNWIHAPGFGTTMSPVMQITLNTIEEPDIRVTGIEVLSEKATPRMIEREDTVAKFIIERRVPGHVFVPPFSGFVVHEDGDPAGAFVLNCYTGADVDFSCAILRPWSIRTARDIARMCFDKLGVQRVTARTRVGNERAADALAAVGFQCEALSRDHFGEDQDALVFVLLKRAQKLVRL